MFRRVYDVFKLRGERETAERNALNRVGIEVATHASLDRIALLYRQYFLYHHAATLDAPVTLAHLVTQWRLPLHRARVMNPLSATCAYRDIEQYESDMGLLLSLRKSFRKHPVQTGGKAIAT